MLHYIFGPLREFQLLEQDARSPYGSLRRRIHLERVIKELLQNTLDALLPLALLQAGELPLEECADDARSVVIAQVRRTGREPGRCRDGMWSLEHLAGSDIRDAVQQRTELLECRTGLKERTRRRRPRELDELVLRKGERVDAAEEGFVRGLDPRSAHSALKSQYMRIAELTLRSPVFA